MEASPDVVCSSSFRYMVPPTDGSEPTVVSTLGSKENSRSNVSWVSKDVEIHDMRARDPATLDLDTNGWVVVTDESVKLEEGQWGHPDYVSVWVSRVEEVVKRVTGSNMVIGQSECGMQVRKVKEADLRPIYTVHVDGSDQQARAMAPQLAAKLVGEDQEAVDRLMKGRIRAFNVWQPINHAAYDVPLALVEGTTTRPEDWIPTRVINPEPFPEGNMLGIGYNPAHRWWTLSGHRPDEILIWKGFDTDKTKCGPLPHSAFNNPRYFGRLEEASRELGFELKPRESCEVRVWVFGP